MGISIGLTCLMLVGCQQGIRDYIGAVGLTRVHADELIVYPCIPLTEGRVSYKKPTDNCLIERIGKRVRAFLYASAREVYESRRIREASASDRGSDVGVDDVIDEGYVLPQEDGYDLGEYIEVASDDSEPEVGEWVYYGNCRITFYDDGPCCCGEWASGYTASGEPAIPGWTVANGSLPFGTMVMIDGQQYCVTDRGVGGDEFDVLVSTHDEALARGLYYTDVYVLN